MAGAPGTIDCPNCGRALPGDARFCAYCGSTLWAAGTGPVAPDEPAYVPVPEPAPTEPDEELTERVAARAPAATRPLGPPPPPPPPPGPPPPRPGGSAAADLARRVGRGLSAPVVALPLALGLVAGVGTLAFALLVAALTSDATLIDLGRLGGAQPAVGVGTEAFRQFTAILQLDLHVAGLNALVADRDAGNTAPLLFLAVPLGLCALAGSACARRLRAVGRPLRLAAAAAIAVPFALCSLVAALAAEGGGATASAALFGGLGWALLGALAGGALVLRHDAGADRRRPPAPVRLALAATGAAARAFALCLAVMVVAGTALVTVQTERDAGGSAGERTVAATGLETASFALEHGVHAMALSGLASFTNQLRPLGGGVTLNGELGLFLPVPVDRPAAVLDGRGSYRSFAYADAAPVWGWLPLVVGGTLVVLALMLFGGFTAARAAHDPRPALGAAWGALVGPVWALLIVVLDPLTSSSYPRLSALGALDGANAFAVFLLLGTVVGACGGLLAASGEPESERAL